MSGIFDDWGDDDPTVDDALDNLDAVTTYDEVVSVMDRVAGADLAPATEQALRAIDEAHEEELARRKRADLVVRFVQQGRSLAEAADQAGLGVEEAAFLLACHPQGLSVMRQRREKMRILMHEQAALAVSGIVPLATRIMNHDVTGDARLLMEGTPIFSKDGDEVGVRRGGSLPIKASDVLAASRLILELATEAPSSEKITDLELEIGAATGDRKTGAIAALRLRMRQGFEGEDP